MHVGAGKGIYRQLNRSILFLGAGFSAFGWSERQLAGAANHFTLLIRKHSFKPRRIDHSIAFIRRHGPQVADRRCHLPLAVGRKLTVLPKQLARLRLLLRRQVLPRFHPIQHAELLLRRQIGKVLQALPEDLLPLRRQAAERRIVLQRSLLLRG